MTTRPTRRSLLRTALVAGGAVLLSGAKPARPGPPLPAGLTPGETGRVAAVLSADTIDLEDGLRVRLAGVQGPAPTRDGSPAWPHAVEATVETSAACLGRTVTLHYADDRRDRWQRALAHLVVDDGTWLQGHLLQRGLARVYTWPRTATGARSMLDLERTARANRRGIWADRFYRIRNPSETWGDLDSWQIVEGRVVDAALVRGNAYLNFGLDWRNDFTFRAESDARRAFRKAGIELPDLTGRRVRGRGWVYPTNGPMIDLTHPAQLEVLED
ncbi:thermonuclease family protein [Thalassobaculum salexigens]|uniref:thermonuclease family protein n=1 Tax=Thalassobaculum salexigens TaxID=455360 RepID=UPI0004098147|nr:thermonuclease family protein [Thalassobaculum salexigens]